MKNRVNYRLTKRPLALLLALCLTLSLLPVSAMAATEAKDLDGHWAANAVETCHTYGIMNGDDNGNYKPNTDITRAEFAALINRAFGYGALSVPKLTGYTDVPSDAWYAGDMQTAIALGIIEGYGNGIAAPEDKITREQAVVILCKILRLNPNSDAQTRFTDIGSASDWAVGSILTMERNGYIAGYNNEFSPTRNLTRAEAAQMLTNVFGVIVDGELDAQGKTYQNVTLRKPGAELKNAVIKGDLFITEGVGNGDIWLDNVQISGRLLAAGGGKNSIHVKDITVGDNVVVDKPSVAGGEPVRFRAIQSNDRTVIIQGTAREIIITEDVIIIIDNDGEKTVFNMFKPEDGSAKPTVVINGNAEVEKITAFVPTDITGGGDVGKVEAHTDGVEISADVNVKPENVEAEKGVEVKVGEETKTGEGITDPTTKPSDPASPPTTTPTPEPTPDPTPAPSNPPSTGGGGNGGGNGGGTTTTNAKTPTISTQPQGASVTVGTTHNLTVAATAADGGTLSYQWYSNTSASTSSGTAIPGATSASYAAPITTAGTIFYYVVVTNTNNSVNGTKTASVTSSVVTLTVNAASTFAVTYNGNGSTGGTVPTDSNSYNSGSTVTVLGNTGTLTKTGHVFAGWNTAADGGGTDYAAGNTFTITANTTLYAKWTAAPAYGVTLSPSGNHTFTAAAYGYGAQTAYSVTVNNIGNQATGALTIALSGTNSSSFTLSKSSISDIAVSGNDSFTVTPNTGLAAGTYAATVTVSGGNSITASFNVSFTVGSAPITSAAITVTAPAKGAAPNDTASGTGNFTIGTVSWTPSHNPFQGGTVYTATVTLTAAANHTFTGGLTTATINGNAATVTNNTGATATLSYQFAATATKSVSSITVKTQPTNLSYTHGDALNLSGLVVTLNYDDSSTEDVALAGFASKNISANPANGAAVSYTTHNSQAVAISCGGQTVDTNTLTVGKKTLTWNTNGTVQSKTYDGNTTATIATAPTLNGVVSGDTVTVSGGTVTFDNENAGSGKSITAAGFGIGGASVGNYNAPSGQPTFANGTITAKAITITPNSGQSKVYGAADPTFTYTPSPALFGGDSFTGNLSYSGTNVGTYAFTLGTLSAGSNYALTLGGSVTFAITPASVTNTGGTATVTYAGSTFDLSAISGLFTIDNNAGTRTYTLETGGNPTGTGTIGADNKTLTVTKAGTFTIGLTTAASGNYAAGTKVTATLTVNKANPTVTAWPSGLTATYGQQKSEISLTAFTNPGGTPGTFHWEMGSDTVGGVGTPSHSMKFIPTDSGNYNNATNSIAITVSKATGAAVGTPTVNGTPTADTITVNAVSPNTATGQTVEYAISTVSNGTGLSEWQSGTTFNSLTASTTYYVYARSASNGNYNAGAYSVSAGITTAITPPPDPNIGMDGSAGKPFKVYNVETLGYVGKGSANPAGYEGWTLAAHYEQIADITLPTVGAGQSNHTPIGNSPFTGSYDGGGHTITGLAAVGTGRQCMFYRIGGTGVVKNLGLVTVTITGSGFVGGVAGDNSGTIINCYVTGSVTSTYGNGVGGVVGQNGGMVQNCYATGSVTAADMYVGGVVGYNNSGTVQNCYATGSVSGSEYIGGVVGYNQTVSSTVRNCVALNLSVTATTNVSTVGRVVGNSGSGTLTNNYAWSGVTVQTGGVYIAVETLDGKDGADITAAQAKTDTQWTTSANWNTTDPAFAWDFTDGTGVWVWDSTGVNMPALRGVGTAQPWPGHLVDPDPNIGMTGTSDKPWKVYDVTTLGYVGKGTANPDGYKDWTLSAHYEQIANITLPTGSPNHTAIGNSTTPFTGTYDGGGHTITNLTINATTDDQGMFGAISGDGTTTGVVKNVGLVDVNINCKDYVGGLAGYIKNNGTVRNCYVTGNVTGVGSVGGVAGHIENGTVENCYSTANVSGSSYVVGGVVGGNGGTVRNCYATGSVSGTQYVGGVAGSAAGSTVQNCVALNTSITATSNTNIGRVVGDSATLTNNYAWSGLVPTSTGGGTWTPAKTHDGKDGANITAAQAKTDTQWTTSTNWNTASPASAWDFTDGTGVWVWDSTGANMPALRGVGTAQPWPSHLILQDGTAGNPFLVTNEADLRKVGTGTDGWTLDAHYKQTASFTMSGGNFTAIGEYATPFTGTYDGGGKTISNLTITASTSNQGMFGYIGENGVVKNLGLVDVSITVNAEAVGGVAGQNYGTVQNCYVTGTVSGTSGGPVGGVVGNNEGTVKNCYATASVSAPFNVGGVVGRNSGTVQNCYATGSVSGTTTNIGMVGGVVGQSESRGQNQNATVKNCVALNSSVTATGNTADIGRVVGHNNTGGIGDSILANNYAWSGLVPTVTGGGTWTKDEGADKKDGADITAATLEAANACLSVFGVNAPNLNTYLPAAEPNLVPLNLAAVTVTIAEGGTVDVTGTEDGYTFIGETVTVTATPDEGWTFSHWEDENGEIVSYDAEYSFEVTGDVTLIAVCVEDAPTEPIEIEGTSADDPRKEPDPVEAPDDNDEEDDSPDGDGGTPDDDGTDGADGLTEGEGDGQLTPQEAIATLNSLLNMCSAARGM